MMSATVRKKMRHTLRALRKDQLQVAEWYGSMKNSPENAWEQIKREFSDAFKAFSDAWERAEKEMRKGN